MAEATSQLQHIADLVTRTSAITHKERGMRIEAGEWNTLVDILLGILQVDRNQETSVGAQLEQRFALHDHEHLGEVGLTWLDPDLQSRIQGTGGASTREALADMDRKLQSIGDDLTALKTADASQQQQLDRSAVSELDRSKALRDFQSKFDGVSNLKTLVGTVSSDVANMRTTFDDVLKLKQSLSDPAGNPLNIAEMQNNIQALQHLSDNFKGVDGNFLSMREIEIRLTDVANVAGVGDNSLDKQFAVFGAQIETKTSENTTKLIATAVDGMKADSKALEGRLNTEIDNARKQAVDSSKTETSNQISASETRQSAAFDAKLKDATTSITENTLKSAGTLIDEKFGGVPEIARNAANQAAVDMGKTISADLKASLSADTTTQIKALEDSTKQRFAPLEDGLKSLRDKLAATVQSAVQSATTDLQTTLNNQLSDAMTKMQRQLETTISTQVSSTVDSSLKDLDQRIGTALQALMPTINKSISLGIADSTKNLNEDIAAELKRQIGDLQLSATIKNAVDASAQQLSATFTSQIAAQDARLTTLVNNTAGTIRGEIRAAIDASISQSKQEILTTVNTRISLISQGGGVTPVIR